MSECYDALVASPVGWLGIRCEGTEVVALDMLSERPAIRVEGLPATSAVTRALQAYFAGDRSACDRIAVRPAGTAFQRRVWERLRAIPPGQTLSYGQLARELGSGARAVGGACRANPVPLAIPCHRVIGASGIGGYSGARGGDWIDKKRWLLRYEGVAL